MKKLLITLMIMTFSVTFINLEIFAKLPQHERLYQCFTEQYIKMYKGWEETNPSLYDDVTQNGQLTVEAAAKNKAKDQIYQSDDNKKYYKCENNKLHISAVARYGWAGSAKYIENDKFKFFPATEKEMNEVCPAYIKKNGDPCKE